MTELPIGPFDVIYADPPWRYEHVRTNSRRIENQYRTMSHSDICSLPVRECAACDATLLLWTTAPKLAEALEVMAAWGFIYRSCAVWDKDTMGMGYYFRIQHELLLLGIVGSPRCPEDGHRPRSIFRSRRGDHSAKPERIRMAIESMYPHARRLELFARERVHGWTCWGNEVGSRGSQLEAFA